MLALGSAIGRKWQPLCAPVGGTPRLSYAPAQRHIAHIVLVHYLCSDESALSKSRGEACCCSGGPVSPGPPSPKPPAPPPRPDIKRPSVRRVPNRKTDDLRMSSSPAAEAVSDQPVPTEPPATPSPQVPPPQPARILVRQNAIKRRNPGPDSDSAASQQAAGPSSRAPNFAEEARQKWLSPHFVQPEVGASTDDYVVSPVPQGKEATALLQRPLGVDYGTVRTGVAMRQGQGNYPLEVRPRLFANYIQRHFILYASVCLSLCLLCWTCCIGGAFRALYTFLHESKRLLRYILA